MLLASLSILAGATFRMPILYPIYGESGWVGMFGPVLGCRNIQHNRRGIAHSKPPINPVRKKRPHKQQHGTQREVGRALPRGNAPY